MIKNIEFKYKGEAISLRPTFELIQQLENSKPILQMLTVAKDGVNLTDVAGYLQALLAESGRKVDRLEALHALSDPSCSGVDAIIMEVLKAAMPHLFDDKKKPEPAAQASPKSKAKKAAAG